MFYYRYCDGPSILSSLNGSSTSEKLIKVPAQKIFKTNTLIRTIYQLRPYLISRILPISIFFFFVEQFYRLLYVQLKLSLSLFLVFFFIFSFVPDLLVNK